MVMPCQQIEHAIFGQVPMIRAASKYTIEKKQIQPASFDFRLGEVGYRMRSSAIPYNETVEELIARYKKYDFPLGTERDHYLEKGMTYIIPLLESLALPGDTFVEFTAKSSTGRVDAFCRVLADRVPNYDLVPSGYHGRLYLEITPLSHDLLVRTGISMVQGRFKTSGTVRVGRRELQDLHMQQAILHNSSGKPLDLKDLDIEDDDLYFHIDLKDRDVVGFVAKDSTLPINMSASEEGKNLHQPYDFWEPIRRPKDGMLELLPSKFYLLATKERVRIPPSVCGQVQTYKTNSGEMRPHYAGFFDNGFGGDQGTNGVLEVRAREVTMRVLDGQRICAMRFEKTFEVPNQLYGQGSSYTGSGPSISKHFEHRYDVWHTGYWSQW